jgi:hypothetical protein
VGEGLGFPCFSGDESAIIFATEDVSAFWTGFSLARQALSVDRLAAVGDPTLWLEDAAVGVIYRRGTFTVSNAPPAVVLTAPAAGTTFTPGSTITLTATATDADGVARVEFYDGSTKLGEDAGSPYSFAWANVAAGNYRLIARATDTHGGSADSSAVQITVGQAQPIRVAAVRVDNQTVRITVNAAPGAYAIEESTSLTQWTTAAALTVGAGGTATWDDTRGVPPEGRRFYRVRQ